MATPRGPLPAGTAALAVALLAGCSPRPPEPFRQCRVLLDSPWGSGPGRIGRQEQPWPGDPDVKVEVIPEDAVEAGGRVYLADTANSRILVIDPERQAAILSMRASWADAEGRPRALAVTDEGTVDAVVSFPAEKMGDRVGRPWALLTFEPGGRCVAVVEEIPWAAEVGQMDWLEADFLGLWSGGRDVYVGFEHRATGERFLFRHRPPYGGLTRMGPLLSNDRAQVAGMTVTQQGSRPLVRQLVRTHSRGDRPGWRHVYRWQTTTLPGEFSSEAEIGFHSRTDGFSVEVVGSDAHGFSYLTTVDYGPAESGRFPSDDVRRSVCVIDAEARLVLEQPSAELETLVTAAGVTSWQRWVYMSVGPSGTLYVSLVSEDRFRLIAFN